MEAHYLMMFGIMYAVTRSGSTVRLFLDGVQQVLEQALMMQVVK